MPHTSPSPSSPPDTTEDDPGELARDFEAIARLGTMQLILELVRDLAGMRFAAVARVTNATWMACAVLDGAGYGAKAGDRLDARATLCRDARETGEPIVFDEARDAGAPRFDRLRLAGILSYVSAPIVLADDSHFGNLCLADPEAGRTSDPAVPGRVRLFAELVAAQLRGDERFAASEVARLDERRASALREHFIEMRRANARKTAAPAGWPCASFGRLEMVQVHASKASRPPCAPAAMRLASAS